MRMPESSIYVFGLVARDEVEEGEAARSRIEFLGKADRFELAVSTVNEKGGVSG